jgi:hypothetical protein
MPPTVGTYASGTTSASPGDPGFAAGDVALLGIESSDSTTAAGTPDTPSGWTKLLEASQPGSGTGVTTLTVFGRIWQAGDSLPSITGVGDHCSGFFVRVPAAEHGATVIGDLVVGTAGKAANSSASVPGITVAAGSTIVWIHTTTRDSNTGNNFSGWAATDPSSFTELGDSCTASGAGGGLGIAWGTCSGTSTGTGTVSAFNANNVGVLIGVPPAPLSEITADIAQTTRAPTQASRLVVEAAGTSYSALVKGDAPIHYYRFDEASGAVATDSVGAIDGTIGAGVTLGATLADGNAFDFDRTATDKVTLSGFYGVNGDISVEVWFELDSLANKNIIIDNGWNGGPTGTGFQIYVDTAGGSQAVLFFRTGDRNSSLATGALIEAGVPYHVVGVQSGLDASLYVNGELVVGPTTLANAPAVRNGVSVIIGQNITAAETTDGRIDEVAIYDHALSQADILAHYQEVAGSGLRADVAQTTGAATQAAVADNPVDADVAQTTGSATQAAVVDNPVEIAGAQTGPAATQTATVSTESAVTAAVAQTAPVATQGALVDAVEEATAAQTAPSLGQAATLDVVLDVDVAQVAPAASQAAVVEVPIDADLAQTAPAASQAAVVEVIAGVTLQGAQTAPAATQAVVADVPVDVSMAQAAPAAAQAATAVAAQPGIDAVVAQVLLPARQRARAVVFNTGGGQEGFEVAGGSMGYGHNKKRLRFAEGEGRVQR